MKIDEELDVRNKQWQSMNRSNDEERKKAEEYYKAEVMPVVIECFLKENKFEGTCEAMALTLGTSYEPLVLSILTLKPQKVLILYTERSLCFLDDVIEFTKLRPSQYRATKVDFENPLQLYKEIKDVYKDWGQPKNIYVDFTGGTKAMAAGCAMAGSAIGAKLIYTAGVFLKEMGKPKPGSEKLYHIDDPYVVFGDLEREQAIALFNKMDYLSAYRIFEELDKRVPGEKEYSALKYISRAYSLWDCLDIRSAKENLNECYKIIQTESVLKKEFVLNEHKELIEKQLEALDVLERIHSSENTDKSVTFDNIGYLIANLYQNAVRREREEKYEMASLLMYRVLEILEQKRLWNYGIDTASADYSKLSIDERTLLQSINSLVKEINESKNVRNFRELRGLEEKISLIAGYLLLVALGDEFMKSSKTSSVESIYQLRKNVNARNKSIFAHGYEFIDRDKYVAFKTIVKEYVERFCGIEKLNKKNIFLSCTFIKL